jgi:hypothetical protein
MEPENVPIKNGCGPKPQGLGNEVVGLVASMLGAAALGALIPGKAEGAVANVVIAAIIGGFWWSRRNAPWQSTLPRIAAIIALGWPVVLVLLDLLHRYY